MTFRQLVTDVADDIQMDLKWSPRKKTFSGERTMPIKSAAGLPEYSTKMQVIASFANSKQGHIGVLLKIGGGLYVLVMRNHAHLTTSVYVLDSTLKSESRMVSGINKSKSIREAFDGVKIACKVQYTKGNKGNWKEFKT